MFAQKQEEAVNEAVGEEEEAKVLDDDGTRINVNEIEDEDVGDIDDIWVCCK